MKSRTPLLPAFALLLTLVVGPPPAAAAVSGSSPGAVEPAPQASGPSFEVAVSAQGNLQLTPSHLVEISPGGTYTLRIEPRQGDFEHLRVDLHVRSAAGGRWEIRDVPGNGFFMAENGRVVVLDASETHALPSSIRVLGLDGRELLRRDLFAPRDATLSADGATFACGTGDGVLLLDLRTLETVEAPKLQVFAPGPGTRLAGVRQEAPENLVLYVPDRPVESVPLSFTPGRIAFSPDGSAVYVLGAQRLLRVVLAPHGTEVVFSAPSGHRLEDLRVSATEITLGMRRTEGDLVTGILVRLYPTGRTRSQEVGPSRRIGNRAEAPRLDGIPWPLAPDAQHPVGNTYGEYQSYGGAPYPHPGFDVMGVPAQPVYAVRGGVVKAILTTSGQWHWRVAVSDSASPDTSLGYLYAHLDQPTILVHVGDMVVAGQHLGDLVEWPTSGFHHCHFTRIQDNGMTWDGNWLSVQNPHIEILHHSETNPPVFQPARGTDLLAFCSNETSTYQSSTSIHGAVDIIAHVSDRIESTWRCTVQELRYTIYPSGQPGNPIVNDKESVYYNFTCDTYGGGAIDGFMIDLLYKQDSTCRTQGDYSNREYYHILTNSNGDRIYDDWDVDEAWDTSNLPDSHYVIRVKAIDAAGNVAVDSMVVQTVNGNPSLVDDGPEAVFPVRSYPNPSAGPVALGFSLQEPGPVRLSICDPSGAVVMRLPQELRGAGRQELVWDGRTADGAQAPAGTYFYRLESAGQIRVGKIQRMR